MAKTKKAAMPPLPVSVYRPSWPPTKGLLRRPYLPELESRPRETWTGDDWKRWACHLEDAGRDLAYLVGELRAQLASTPKKGQRGRPPKASRSRASGLISTGLLANVQPRKGGRPKNIGDDVWRDFADEVEAKRSTLGLSRIDMIRAAVSERTTGTGPLKDRRLEKRAQLLARNCSRVLPIVLNKKGPRKKP